MRGESSSKKSISTKNGGEELENLEKLKENEETHLSGSYIRTLVKQLTSSRTKENKNSNGEVNSCTSTQNSAKNGEGFVAKPKKQVRRRLHTSRPYQERLLNMAEARREIVAALKFHRAAMRKAQEMENQPLMESESQQICLENEAKLKSRRNPRIYASSNSFSNFSYCPSGPADYSWHVSPISPPPPPPPIFQENLNFPLPNQPLGLNLNFQDFDLDTTPYYNPTTPPPSLFSSSSASSSSSPPLSATATAETPCMAAAVADSSMPEMDLDLHPAMDDKEMAEIRSIGEQHQIEWNDTMNLLNSAWWFKFLKAMEISPEEKAEDYGLFSPFDEVLEFPSWVNANESCLNDYCSGDYLQDPALPCMEIEEIEGMEEDWSA